MTHPLTLICLFVLGAVLFGLGLRALIPAFKRIDDADGLILLARGARKAIAGVALGVIGLALEIGNDGLFWFGVVFLLEELYETTMVLGVMKWHVKHEVACLQPTI